MEEDNIDRDINIANVVRRVVREMAITSLPTSSSTSYATARRATTTPPAPRARVHVAVATPHPPLDEATTAAVAVPVPAPSATRGAEQQATEMSTQEQAVPGRPRVKFDTNHAKQMLDLGFSITDVGHHFGVSRQTVYRHLRLSHPEALTRFKDISDEALHALVQEVKNSHPNAGEVYLMGHLRSKNVIIPRQRLRDVLHAIDPEGIERRRRLTVTRRVYSVPCPNYLWHIDGTHKLIRWKFVIHAGIDGFSRLIPYLNCSTNNLSTTVLHLFQEAVQQYGFPLHVRSDYGGENQKVWDAMIQERGEASRPVIVGSSVHNERVERLNYDINQQVVSVFKPLFLELEEEGVLDADNSTDLFCLHRTFLPKINQHLQEFRSAHNNHRISTEGNRTPVQLFFQNVHLMELHANAEDPHPGISAEELMQQGGVRQVDVDSIGTPLSQQQLRALDELELTFPSTMDSKAKYRSISSFVADQLL